MIATRSRQLVAIALASFSILFFEITITRILSVVLWYHWAFLSVSLAMLGLGVPGVWFHLRPPSPRLLGRLLVAAGVALPLSIVAIFGLSSRFGAYAVVFCMFCLLVPLLLLGAAVCILLLDAPGRSIGLVYGADLFGASLAALLVIWAMHLAPTPHLAAALGLLPLAAAWCLEPQRWKRVVPIIVGLLVLLMWGEPLRVRVSKAYDERVHQPIYERWTPIARLTFFDGIFFRAFPDNAFGWGLGNNAPPVHIKQYWLEQDGSAGSPVTSFDGDLDKLSFLDYDVTTVGYQFAHPRHVAIIGAGGGRDILSARLAGAKHIDAVELNGQIVEIVSTVFGEMSGDVYHLDGVRPVVSEGRSYLTRVGAHYDFIQISLIDSWAATAAGAFALSENSLYTVEAYRLYWDRLSEHGLLSTSRWMRGPMGLEMPRLIGLHRAALLAAGIDRPETHLAVIGGGPSGTVLMSKRPFTAESAERLAAICDERGFQLHYPPIGADSDPMIRAVVERGPTALVADSFDLSPPTDDRPFFFQVLPVFRPVDITEARIHGVNGEAVFVLQILIIILATLTLILFFSPFFLSRWRPRHGEFWRGSLYFACIGLAFMLVEIPWLHRFILFLGHPSYATTVVLGSLLLGASVGSLVSSRLGVAWLRRWGVVVPVVVATVNLLFPAMIELTLGWQLPARVGVAALLLGPAGFLFGLFFPLGMLRFGDENKAWYWAMNGACSVIASVISVAMAMAFGYALVVWLGVACYALAIVLLGGAAHPANSIRQEEVSMTGQRL